MMTDSEQHAEDRGRGREVNRRALALLSEQKFGEAVRLLQEAASQLPESALIRYDLGVAYWMGAPEDDDATAERMLEKGAKAFEEAVALHERHGGLDADQLATATRCIQQWKSRSVDLLANSILDAIDEYGLVAPERLLASVRTLGTREEILASLSRIEEGIRSGELRRSYLHTMTFVDLIRKWLG